MAKKYIVSIIDCPNCGKSCELLGEGTADDNVLVEYTCPRCGHADKWLEDKSGNMLGLAESVGEAGPLVRVKLVDSDDQSNDFDEYLSLPELRNIAGLGWACQLLEREDWVTGRIFIDVTIGGQWIRIATFTGWQSF